MAQSTKFRILPIAALPTVYPGIPLQRLLGAQSQERAGQGPQGRPRRRQDCPPRHHERPQPAQGAQCRTPLRQCLGRDHPSATPPFSEPPTPSNPDDTSMDRILFAVFIAQGVSTPLPRGPAQDPTHGHIPGPHINGPHPLRRLHPRKQARDVAPDTPTPQH